MEEAIFDLREIQYTENNRGSLMGPEVYDVCMMDGEIFTLRAVIGEEDGLPKKSWWSKSLFESSGN